MFYIVFRAYEWHLKDDGGRRFIAEQHTINLKNKDSVDCLILGGSNAVFSLSAEQVSNETNLNCYNLSLLNEGYSFSNYWKFIGLLPINFSGVKYVFYSSIVPYRDNSYLDNRFKNVPDDVTISGDMSFRLIGHSLATRLKQWASNGSLDMVGHKYPIPNIYGDFDFSKYNVCGDYIDTKSKQITEMVLLKHWIDSQLNEISSLFTNTNIYFVIPSELRSSSFNPSIQDNVLKSMESVITMYDETSLIVQPPFESRLQLCDAKHHANEDGRRWSTSHLINSFINLNK
jgi:hypothetical protein